MAIARSIDEEIPLLDDDKTVVSMPANPINTAAILFKLEKENQRRLADSLQRIRNINCREKSKYLLPAGGIALFLGGTSAFIYFLTRFVKLPSPLELYHQLMGEQPDFALKYFNAFITEMNATCGTKFPLANICDFDSALNRDEIHCARQASDICADSRNLNESISYYQESCIDAHPQDILCNWEYAAKKYADECFWRARDLWKDYGCNSTSATSLYRNTTLTETAVKLGFGPLNVTCGELFPVNDICDWAGYQSSVVWNCARQAYRICSAQTRLLYEMTQFSSSKIPGYDYACGDNHSLTDVCLPQISPSACRYQAYIICGEQMSWNDKYNNYDGDKTWMSDERFLTLVGAIAAMLLLISIMVALLIKGTGCLNQKQTIGELPQSERDELFPALETYSPDFAKNHTTISNAADALGQAQRQLPEDKSLLNRMRLSFLSVRGFFGSRMHDMLATETVVKIFYHADLSRVPPEKIDANNEAALSYARNLVRS